MRLALGVEYDGSLYHGWQLQKSASSVQQVVEAALSRVANHPVRVHCSGRTDTGVHALGQVIHFDTQAQRSERSWILGGNANLPQGVSILWVKEVSDEFHARFSAQARIYRYVIFNRWVRPAVLARRVSWIRETLDVERMIEAANCLLGEHDFSAFRSAACQAHQPVRTIHKLDLQRRGDTVVLDIEANGFLHHMVRNIAGSLIPVGKAEAAVDWVYEVLEGKDRTLAGPTAPPHGLYFVSARYPDEFGLPLNHVPQLF